MATDERTQQMLDAVYAPTNERADEIMGGSLSAALAQTAHPPWTPDPQRQAEVAWEKKHYGVETPATDIDPNQGVLPLEGKAKLMAAGRAMLERLNSETAFPERGPEHDLAR